MNWNALDKFVVKKGDVGAIWLVAREVISGYGHLRLIAEGKWTFPAGPTTPCDPDGAIGLSLPPEGLLLAGSPAGCLVGRLGGSTASYRGGPPPPTPAEGETETPEAVGAVFAIGRYCVIKVPPKEFGPLLVGFNLVARPVTVDEPIELSISGANFT